MPATRMFELRIDRPSPRDSTSAGLRSRRSRYVECYSKLPTLLRRGGLRQRPSLRIPGPPHVCQEFPQQPEFGVVQTAALVAPRVTPLCLSRAKTRFIPGSNAIDPLAWAKKAKLRFVPAV